MSHSLRLALIADIHHGHMTQTKAGSCALPLLEQFVRAVNEMEPDVVVDLGDRVNDLDHETDLQRLREVAERFRAVRPPRVHLLGNHDQVNLSVEDSETALGVRHRSSTIDIGGWHLVFWAPVSRPSAGGVYRIDEADLAWLDADLETTNHPSIIVTHVPFDDGSMVGNYYFEDSPAGAAGYINAGEARALVRRTSKTVLVVAGHVHWNAVNVIDGIPYVTIQSLTERFTTYPHPAAAWATLEVTPDTLDLRVVGRDRVALSRPIKPRGTHWLRQHDCIPRLVRSPDDGAPSRRPHPLAGVRGVILDLDGVVYKEEVLLPGARAFVSFLQRTGRRVVALTNHSGSSAEEYAQKLERLGAGIPKDNIVTSAWATAQYLRQRHPGARILTVGNAALKAELWSVGLVESRDPEYVVVGYDSALNLPQLADATRCLLDGAALIGTNADAVRPTPAGFVPECGPVVAFLERASGRRATIVGKPSAFIVGAALDRLGVGRHEALIVGDTVDTDIQAGVAAGIRTALVLTGNTERAPQGPPQPTITVPNLDVLRLQLADDLDAALSERSDERTETFGPE
jgi:Icc protein